MEQWRELADEFADELLPHILSLELRCEIARKLIKRTVEEAIVISLRAGNKDECIRLLRASIKNADKFDSKMAGEK